MARHDQRVGYGVPTILAVALHLGVVVFSVISLPAKDPEPTSSSIVQATLVSTETVTDQAQRAEEARARAQAREAEEQRQAEEAARQAEQEAEASEAQRQAEQQAQREAEARAREEARQAAEAEAARRAEEAEQQARLREQQAEERRAQQQEAERQQQLEAQRQAEAEAERQRQAEAQRRAEEEAARRAAEEAEAALQRIIEGEREAAANARQGQEAANSFINLVRRAVEQAWVIPPNVPSGATAEVAVRLGPSGELFAASISQSSGDSAFDRSAIQAVEAAAPFAELRQLPAAVQRDYRQFNLRFRPGDVR